MISSLARRLAGLTLAVVVSGWQPVAADATTKHMVALGDSYASGVGTRSYYARSGSCRRSPYAYPVIASERAGAALSFQACSGATTWRVINRQLGTLSRRTSLVTVTVGGNDVGFRSVLAECAQPWWSSDCDAAIDSARAKIKHRLPGSLGALYRRIHAKAARATIVVVGYPRLFNGEDCNAGTWFSPAEETRLNRTADLLDATIKTRAQRHGFRFVDPRAAFAGHAVCAEHEWLNGLSDPVSESYHPNRRGQRRGYSNLVDGYLG